MAVASTDITVERTTRGSIGRPAILVTALTGVQTGLQFLIQVILAAFFGAGHVLDAYFAAYTVPLIVTSVFLGVVYVTLVPLITEARMSKSDQDADRLGLQFASATLLGLGSLMMLLSLFSGTTARLLVPGFGPQEHLLTARLLRIILPASAITGTSIVLSCIYYSRREYWIPALYPIMHGGIALLSILLFSGKWGVMAAAWGTLVGASSGMILMLACLAMRGAAIFQFRWDHPGLRTSIRLMSALLVASLFVRATLIIDKVFASYLGEGAITLVNFASRITAVAAVLSVQGISVSLFPLFSRAAARDDSDELSHLLHLGLRGSLLIAGLVVSTMLVLRHEVVSLLFQYGEMNPSDISVISNLLVWYTGLLVFLIVGNGITSVLYSLKATRLVAAVSITGALLYVPAVAILIRVIGMNGIAAASSLIAACNIAVMVYFLHKRWVRLRVRELLVCLGRVGMASGVAALVQAMVCAMLADLGTGIWSKAVAILATVLIGLLVYLACLVAVGAKEARWILGKSVSTIRQRRAA